MKLKNRVIFLSEKTVIFLLLALTGLMLIQAFGPVIQHPNNYLFAAGGDGLKTYYASSWFVKHNPAGALHTGFAYPHGNHLVYADLNPTLSWLMRFFSRNVTDISGYVPGIINYSMILSFFPAVFFLFLILRKNHLNQGFAFLFAIVITWLSPQIDRFTGHYALSYIFFVPMMWYLLIRLFEGKKIALWLGLYLLATVIFEFAHPYHFLIGGGFLFAYAFVHLLQNFSAWRKNLKIYLPVFLLGALPIVILLGWQKETTTTATDFVKYPYGFDYYLAGFETIFLPARPSEYRPSPLWEVYKYTGIWDHFSDSDKDSLEGSAYVGIVGFMMLWVIFLRMGWLLLAGLQSAIQSPEKRLRAFWHRGAKRIFRPVLPAPLAPAIWAAFLLLPLATGWLFDKLPFLLEMADFLRQFRSLGRLAWPFYYAFMVLCAWLFFALYRRLRMQSRGSRLWLAGVWLILGASALWMLEARILYKAQTQFIFQNTIDPNYKNWKADYTALLTEKGYQPDDFQAILAFPFYHVGSEKLVMEGWHASFFSKAASLNLGLPIVNNYVARAPLTPSLETIQLVAHPLIRKTLPAKFPNQKPLLLLYTYTEEKPPMREAYLIDQSELLFQLANMHFALLPLDAFEDQAEEAVEKFEGLKDSLYQAAVGVFVTDSTNAIVIEGFDKEKGEMKHVEERNAVIFEGEIPSASDNTPMELSIWVKLDIESNYLPGLIVQQFEGETSVSWDWKGMKSTTDVVGEWARVEIPFSLQKAGNRIRLFSDGEKLSFDNLLIRPQGVDVYCEAGGRLVLNNYFLK